MSNVISQQTPQQLGITKPKPGEQLWWVVVDDGDNYKPTHVCIANSDKWSSPVDFRSLGNSNNGGSTGLTAVQITNSTTAIPGSLYLAETQSILNLVLPVTASDGDAFGFINNGSGTIRITQSANQKIIAGDTVTTLGVTGSVSSFNYGDWVEFLYTDAAWWASIKAGYLEVL
jgi:hypothetical protein